MMFLWRKILGLGLSLGLGFERFWSRKGWSRSRMVRSRSRMMRPRLPSLACTNKCAQRNIFVCSQIITQWDKDFVLNKVYLQCNTRGAILYYRDVRACFRGNRVQNFTHLRAFLCMQNGIQRLTHTGCVYKRLIFKAHALTSLSFS